MSKTRPDKKYSSNTSAPALAKFTNYVKKPHGPHKLYRVTFLKTQTCKEISTIDAAGPLLPESRKFKTDQEELILADAKAEYRTLVAKPPLLHKKAVHSY